MLRDAEATRQRLLDAATEEFAARGIAGARVDRIAHAARSNKAQIYHYFGSKDGLFDAVFDRIVQATVAETPIDPTDLPEYAGRLFDRYQQHPEIQRLATWYRLERADGDDPIEAIVVSNAAKVKAIADAQRAGLLTTRFEPAVLLALVLNVSGTWSTMTPEYSGLVKRLPVAKRRRAIVNAVTALLA
jgi:AcrR family transcriptional regulator